MGDSQPVMLMDAVDDVVLTVEPVEGNNFHHFSISTPFLVYSLLIDWHNPLSKDSKYSYSRITKSFRVAKIAICVHLNITMNHHILDGIMLMSSYGVHVFLTITGNFRKTLI